MITTSMFIAAVIVLFYAGGLIVRNLVWIGRYFQMSEYTLSFILISFATSLPEFFTGITSALEGVSEISLGNVISANVFNITLVLGVTIILAGNLKIDSTVRKEDVFITFGIIALPIVLLLDHNLGRLDGAVLILAFVGYIIYLLDQSRKTPVIDTMPVAERRIIPFMKHLGKFVGGIILLLASAWVVVTLGVEFAKKINLPLFAVGALIAVGTTLPEMVFSMKSVLLRHISMSLGNAFGSIVLNTSLILGVAALISPLRDVSLGAVFSGMAIVLFLTAFLQVIGRLKGYFPRLIGLTLLAFGFLFVFLEGMFI